MRLDEKISPRHDLKKRQEPLHAVRRANNELLCRMDGLRRLQSTGCKLKRLIAKTIHGDESAAGFILISVSCSPSTIGKVGSPTSGILF
jgi:hypothetical protein